MTKDFDGDGDVRFTRIDTSSSKYVVLDGAT